MRPVALCLATLSAVALLVIGGLIASHRSVSPASAEQAGVITGQIVWGSPGPVIYTSPAQPGMEPAPDESAEPSVEPAPEVAPQIAPDGRVMPMPPIIRPPVPRPIPAGAVLVAVQGTGVSTRTDENGRFRLEGVPTGQYLTVAAGPVSGTGTAFVLRPNVYLAPRQDGSSPTVGLGRLYLGQPYRYGPVPYGSEAPDAATEEAPQ